MNNPLRHYINIIFHSDKINISRVSASSPQLRFIFTLKYLTRSEKKCDIQWFDYEIDSHRL